jgi:hypothetical protein
MGMSVLLIFIDGIGVGVGDPDVNPMAARSWRVFSHLRDDPPAVDIAAGGLAFSLDASLGIPGLPQSATGQTALFTGINAPRFEGRHVDGFPTRKLRDLLFRTNILKDARERGFSSTFLNAYRPGIEQLLEKKRYRLLSATTVATIGAGLPFRTLRDLAARNAVYQEFTNSSLIDRDFDVPRFTPEEAGMITARLAENHDFSLFEYFQTDRVGHRADMERAVAEIAMLERFLLSLLDHADLSRLTVLLTSDHGNIEDVTTGRHTENPVLAAVWGPRTGDFSRGLCSLIDVKPAILACLEERKLPEPQDVTKECLPQDPPH